MPSNKESQSDLADSSASSPSQAVATIYRTAIERQAKSLKGKERYQYLLERKTKELEGLQDRKSETEAVYYAIPATRSQKDRRDQLIQELDEIDESIFAVLEQIQTLQQRVQSFKQTGHPWQTPIRPTAPDVSTMEHFSTPAAQARAPAGTSASQSTRPFFADPFSNTTPAEKPTELNPKQFIVPANLPNFRHSEKAIQDIDIFTRQFELTLNAHGLSYNKVWSRLLPLCLSFEMQDWLHRTHSSSHTWAQVRDSLHQQYGDPTKRRTAVVKIYSSRQQSDESIIDFMQRFMRLIRQAQAQPDNQDMVDYLLEQFPTDLAIQLESAVKYGKIQRNVVDMEAFARTFPGVHNKKRTSSSEKVPAGRFSTKSLYCATHGHCMHTTAQCKHPKKSTTQKSLYKSASHALSNTPKSTPNDQSNNTLSSDKMPTCYRCHETGHYANKCPTLESVIKSRRTWLRANDKHLSHNDLSEFEIPVQINGHSATALVDTGANTSFIAQAYAKQLDLPIKQAEGIIELAVPGFSTPRIGHTDQVQLTCGNETLNIKLEVIKELNGPPIFLGTDVLSMLNIPLNGLPFRLNDAVVAGEQQIDQILPAIEPTLAESSVDAPTEEQISNAMQAIQPELGDNASIPPSEPCPLEMAVVRLDTPEGRFTHRRQFPIAEKLKPAMQEIIDEWIDEGVIARITEPTQFNTPIFPIPKKNPSGAKTLCRPCMDFRALNDLITSDKYPLPLISDIFETLKGSKYFTSLDLKSAYHRFPVLAEHQHKTAFTWNDVQYKFLRAPFGLKNLPSQFQRVIHFVFQGCPFVRTFIDDAIVFSPDWESHVQHVKQAIARLNEARLILNVPKCHVFQTSLLLLGFRIDAYGHSIDHEHAKKAVDWPVPTTGKQVQAYLGFVNYFREHIPMVSKLTAPLDKLRTLKRITPSEWTADCQQAFNKLKSILFAAPALAYPDFSQPFFVATDASGVGIGAVLYQFCPDTKKQCFVSFQARALTSSERNYSATKRELLAIVFAIRKFHRYLWGTHFTLYTDHRALTYLHTQQNLSPMLVGWFDLIFDYNFAVFHRPGIRNVLPDALSRFFPEETPFSEPTNIQIRTVKVSEGSHSKEGGEADLSARPSQDLAIPHCTKLEAVKYMVEPERYTVTLRSASIKQPGDMTPEQQRQLLYKQHLLGHFGPEAIVKALKTKNISWPHMLDDAVNICSFCIQCLRYNIARRGYHPLTTIVADQPFDHLAVDLAGPFTTSVDKQHWLLVIIDIHSRFVLLRTLPDKSGSEVAQALLKVFYDFGFPRIIQSDNGTEFVNQIIKDITPKAKIDHRLITPYHPRANGSAERTVQTAKRLILKLIRGIKHEWSLFVPFAQYCINTKIAVRTKTTPFVAMFGRPPNNFEDHSEAQEAPPSEHAMEERALFMQETLFPALRDATEKVANAVKERFDKQHRLIDIPAGTYVMCSDKTRTTKTDPANEGPFKVIRRTQGGSYELQDLDGQVLTRRYPPRDLIPISNNNIFEEESYEVDKVVAHRHTNDNEIEYKVRWKGYSTAHDTWEPFANFDSIAPIDAYWNRKSKSGGKCCAYTTFQLCVCVCVCVLY